MQQKKAPTDQSSNQGQWGPPLKGHQGESDEEYHQGSRPHWNFYHSWEKGVKEGGVPKAAD